MLFCCFGHNSPDHVLFDYLSQVSLEIGSGHERKRFIVSLVKILHDQKRWKESGLFSAPQRPNICE